MAGLLGSANLMGLLTPELGGWYLPPITGSGSLSQEAFLTGTGVVGPALSALADKLQLLREECKQTKEFSAVDEMKSYLIAAGVEVRMSKDGVTLVPGAGFDRDEAGGR